ncbi:MAG: arylsulfatase [Maricaulaceae bacterium]|jgi:arylsulfatase
MKPSSHASRGRVLARASGLAAAIVMAALARSPALAQPEDGQRPNFVLIVADDLGFSDLGSYGGEIHTPNIDRLAESGLRFANFYVAPNCSPTRSMLMTGLDNHVVGMGNMHERTAPNQLGQPGYEGVLRTDVETVADALLGTGYHTYMVGKWHLGHDPEHLPVARGFERSFSMLNGAGSHFDMTGTNRDNEESEFVENGEYLTRLPRRYYSTRTFTDKIIEYIDENRDDGQPFFAYVAHQAPHDPLQVPDSWLRRYFGAYDDGWDVLREERLERMREIGLLPAHTEVAPRLWYVPEWERMTLIARAQSSRRMEVYAAMVEYLDQEVGRLVDYLEETGEFENTIIIFMSDNGPSPSDPIQQARQGAGVTLDANFYATHYRTDFQSMGRHNSFAAQSQPWAQVSATPFNGFKLTTFDGGVRSPLIIWSQDQAGAGSVNTADVLHVSDIAPTLLDLAGADPASFNARPGQDLQRGRSWRPLIEAPGANEGSIVEGLGMEIFGGRAYREGDWKITWMYAPYGNDDWQLFNLASDPSESQDLSDEFPELRARMIAAWDAYAAANNVIVPDLTVFDGMEENLPPRPPVDAPDWPRGQESNWSSN